MRLNKNMEVKDFKYHKLIKKRIMLKMNLRSIPLLLIYVSPAETVISKPFIKNLIL